MQPWLQPECLSHLYICWCIYLLKFDSEWHLKQISYFPGHFLKYFKEDLDQYYRKRTIGFQGIRDKVILKGVSKLFITFSIGLSPFCFILHCHYTLKLSSTRSDIYDEVTFDLTLLWAWTFLHGDLKIFLSTVTTHLNCLPEYQTFMMKYLLI